MSYSRELRNEARVTEIVKFINEPIPCEDVRNHFVKAWGVHEETVRKVLVWAVKSGRITRKYRNYEPV